MYSHLSEINTIDREILSNFLEHGKYRSLKKIKNTRTFLITKPSKKILKIFYVRELGINGFDIKRLKDKLDSYNSKLCLSPKIYEIKKSGEKICCIEEFIEGKPVISNIYPAMLIDKNNISLLAKSLAEFHNAFIKNTFKGYPNIIKEKCPNLIKEIKNQNLIPKYSTIIHGDLSLGNIIKTENGFSFIDIERRAVRYSIGEYNDPVIDVCKILLELKNCYFWREEYFDLFLKNYHDITLSKEGFQIFEKRLDIYMRFLKDEMMQNTIGIQSISFQLTQNCNLSCEYCYQQFNKTQDNNKELDYKNLKDALGILLSKSKKRIKINFTGGEPLLKFDLIRRIVKDIRGIKDKEIHLKLTTNGTLLNQKIIEFLSDNKFSILVSCDNLLNELRFKSSILNVKLLNNIKKLNKYDCDFSARMTIHPDYVQNLFDDFIILRRLGFSRFEIQPCIMPDTKWDGDKISLFIFNFKKIVNEWLKSRGTKEEFALLDIEGLLLNKSQNFDRYYSGDCSDTVFVSSEGKIHFCECGLGYFFALPPSYQIGDIKRGLYPEKIYTSKKAMKFSKFINNKLITCGKPCFYRFLPEGKTNEKDFYNFYKLNKARWDLVKEAIISHSTQG